MQAPAHRPVVYQNTTRPPAPAAQTSQRSCSSTGPMAPPSIAYPPPTGTGSGGSSGSGGSGGSGPVSPPSMNAAAPPPASSSMAVTQAAVSSSSTLSSSPSNPVLEELQSKHIYNPNEFDLTAKNARFFVIKSYSEDDIHRSIKYEIWCSTEHGNKRLDSAFRERYHFHPILFHSSTALTTVP